MTFFKLKKFNVFNNKLKLFSKLKMKLFSYFDQKACFSWENLKVVTFTIIVHPTDITVQISHNVLIP